MSIRIVCSDGEERVPKVFLKKMSLFENKPELAESDSYTLRSKVDKDLLNLFLEKVYDDTAEVDPREITENNFAQLKALSAELGFYRFDKALKVFEAGRLILLEERLDEYDEKLEDFETELLDVHDTLKDKVEDQEFSICQLKQQLKKHEKLFEEFERRLNELESGRIENLERKIEEVGRECESRSEEVLRKVDQAMEECPKRSDLEDLTAEVERLKRSEKEICIHPQQPTTLTSVAASGATSPSLEDSLSTAKTSTSGMEMFNQPDNASKEPEREFVYDDSKKLNGIIAHLTREFGGNVHDKGIVYVTASSFYEDLYRPENAANLGEGEDFRSQDEPDSWICYDFRERRVIPTSYSVRSNGTSPGGSHLKSWVIEVSNDGYSWTEVDRREDNTDLNDKFALCNFNISDTPSESFRFFRLRQTGKNHVDDDVMRISSLEIFGTLSMSEKVDRPPKQEFVYHEDREGQSPPPLFPPKLDGIIAHLTRKFGGNVHDKGIVDVTASSAIDDGFDDDDYHPKMTVDLGTLSESFWSEDEENSWICYDFKERRVTPTSYSVRSSDGIFLKSWVIEVSNHRDSWTEIDHREDNNDLKGQYALCNFEIPHVPGDSFRFFRLRQTGKNHTGNDSLSFSALEIFGTLFEK